MIITKLIIKIRKKYCGWSKQAYVYYREELGHSRLRAYRGAFLLRNLL